MKVKLVSLSYVKKNDKLKVNKWGFAISGIALFDILSFTSMRVFFLTD